MTTITLLHTTLSLQLIANQSPVNTLVSSHDWSPAAAINSDDRGSGVSQCFSNPKGIYGPNLLNGQFGPFFMSRLDEWMNDAGL